MSGFGNGSKGGGQAQMSQMPWMKPQYGAQQQPPAEGQMSAAVMPSRQMMPQGGKGGQMGNSKGGKGGGGVMPQRRPWMGGY